MQYYIAMPVQLISASNDRVRMPSAGSNGYIVFPVTSKRDFDTIGMLNKLTEPAQRDKSMLHIRDIYGDNDRVFAFSRVSQEELDGFRQKDGVEIRNVTSWGELLRAHRELLARSHDDPSGIPAGGRRNTGRGGGKLL